MLAISVGGIDYQAAPDGTITPANVVAALVGDLLETGEPIGPQTDELVGVVGSIDGYPLSVIAAFIDVADRLDLEVGGATTPPDTVTAGLGDGGFDPLGNWHDPGSGEFAHPGVSTAKAEIENAFRKMLADARRPGGVMAHLDRDYPGSGHKAGDLVMARYHDDRHAAIYNDHRTILVPWAAVSPEGGAYAKLRTQGRETPNGPEFNDMNVYKRNGRHYRIQVPNRGGGYVAPADTPAGAAHAAGDAGAVLAFNDKASPALVARFGPTPRVAWVDSDWGTIVGGTPGESYVYWHNFDLPAQPDAEFNDLPPSAVEWFHRYAAEHPTLIHVTTNEAARSIWANGLRPGGGEIIGGSSIIPRPDHVYLADDRWESYDISDLIGLGDEYSVIEVDTAKLDWQNLSPDEDVFIGLDHEPELKRLFIEAGLDPAEFKAADQIGDNGLWAERVNLGSQPALTEAAIDLRGAIAYRGTVPPEAMKALRRYKNYEPLPDAEFNDLPAAQPTKLTPVQTAAITSIVEDGGPHGPSYDAEASIWVRSVPRGQTIKGLQQRGLAGTRTLDHHPLDRFDTGYKAPLTDAGIALRAELRADWVAEHPDSTLARRVAAPEFNDLPARPDIAATTAWYETTIDGETFAPNIRTAEPPTFVLAARDKPGGPFRPVGYSTAADEAGALEDAEVAAPYAIEYRAGQAVVRTEAPPDLIRTFRRPDLDIEADGEYRYHEAVTVNGEPAGVIRRADAGIGNETGEITALPAASSQVLGPFDTRQDAIDAVASYAIEHPWNPGSGDTDGTIHRQAISTEFAAIVRERAAALNKRAERKGLTGRVEVTTTDPYVSHYTDEITGHRTAYEATDLTITTTPVSLDGGWTFAGTVDYRTMREANPSADPDDPSMVLLHSAGGYQLPEAFRAAAVCDDCHRAMPRQKLIVAADADGNLTRLGTTCVRDVLGHDPSKLVWLAEAVGRLADDPDGVLRRPPEVWPAEDAVAMAFIAADEFGWTKAKAEKGIPTKTLVMGASEQPRQSDPPQLTRFRELLADPTVWATARTKAQAAIAYVKSDAFRKNNEYRQNLHRSVTSELVTKRTVGTAVSIVPMYNQHMAQQAADAARAASVPNEWVGQPGDKIEMTGVIRTLHTFESDYGTKSIITIDTDKGTLKTFVDAHGGFAGAANDAGEGGPIRFKGTIKEHDEFPKGSGQKETAILRAAYVPTRLDKLRDAEAQVDDNRRRDYYGSLRGVTQHVEQASFSIGGDGQAEWKAEMQATLKTLPAYRLDQIIDGARAEETRLGAEQPQYVRTGSGTAGNGVGADSLIRRTEIVDGTTIGYATPPHRYDDKPTMPDPILPLAQRPLTVRRTADTVNLVDPATGDVVVSHGMLADATARVEAYNKLDSKAKYGGIGGDPAPKPDFPTLWVINTPGDRYPWTDNGYDATLHDGTEVHLNPDGTIDGPRPEGNVWSAAVDQAAKASRQTVRKAMVEWLNTAVAEPFDPQTGDGDVLTADNLEQLVTPIEVTKGRKVYRIEAGGDVYTVPDAKRVTDKTGDPVLRQALTDAGFDAADVTPYLPEPEPADPPTVAEPEFNDLPERPTAREVGSHEIQALTDLADYPEYLRDNASDPAQPVLAEAWAGDIASGTAAGVQWAAADAFGTPTTVLGDTRDADTARLAAAAAADDRAGFDPVAALKFLHGNTQAFLAQEGIGPTDRVNLYRGLTAEQGDAYERAGRPDRITSAPLAAYTAAFDVADTHGPGGVVTVSVPAANIVAIGSLGGDTTQIVAFPDPDGGLPVTRFRSLADDTAAAADDVEVGEVFTTDLGVKVLRTPSGFVDQATGQPVHADGTPID